MYVITACASGGFIRNCGISSSVPSFRIDNATMFDAIARSEGLEPPTYKFVACCSIQLSYDRVLYLLRRGRDSNPRYAFTTYDGLANRCLQPLGHLSMQLDL